MTKYGRHQAQASTKSFKIVDQAFKSIKDIKLNNSFNFYIKSFFNITNTLAEVSVKKIVYVASPKILMELLTYMFAFGIILYSILLKYSSLSEIILLIGIYTITLHRILPNIQTIFQEVSNYKYYKPSFDELFSDLKKVNFHNYSDKKNLQKFKFSKISLNNVSFNYFNNKNKVLSIDNLNFSSGSYIGITGKSGSGKSTLINLITGLLKPDKGNV